MAANASFSFNGSGSLTNPLDVSNPSDEPRIGDLWPAMQVVLTDGTGSGQVNYWWHDKRTLAAGITDTITLNTTTPVNAFGSALDLSAGSSKVKGLILWIADPLVTKALEIGPQADANACSLGIVGTSTAANAKRTITTMDIFLEPFAGIAPGTKLLIKNVGSVSLDYWLWLLAVKL